MTYTELLLAIPVTIFVGGGLLFLYECRRF
jgi:hypothetical protein